MRRVALVWSGRKAGASIVLVLVVVLILETRFFLPPGVATGLSLLNGQEILTGQTADRLFVCHLACHGQIENEDDDEYENDRGRALKPGTITPGRKPRDRQRRTLP
jgi:hypothetical protein